MSEEEEKEVEEKEEKEEEDKEGGRRCLPTICVITACYNTRRSMVFKVFFMSYLPICAWKVPLSAMNSEIISLVKNLRLVDSMKSSAYRNRIITITTTTVIHHSDTSQ